MVEKDEQFVYDIRSYEPRPEQAFLVDTNAWFWISYSRATLPVLLGRPAKRQHEQYERFIKKALDVGCTIGRCDLILSELAHQIENTERKIYEHHSLGQKEIFLKDYRAIPEERKRVVSEVTNAWDMVTRMSENCAVTIDGSATRAALEAFRVYPIGGYDIFLLEAMKNKGLKSILTDDSDFAGVGGISIFTSNVRVLEEAKKAGRLVQ